MNRRMILFIAVIVIIGELIGFASFDYYSTTATTQSYGVTTIYGYELYTVTYDQKVISPIGVNEFTSGNPSNISLFFTEKPSSVSVTYCEIQITSVNGNLLGSGCTQSSSQLNITFESDESDYQYTTQSLLLPSSSSNNAGVQANVTYSVSTGTETYSYDLFFHVTKTVPVKGNPHYASFDSANNNLYVTEFAGNSVAELSSSSNSVVATLSGFNEPFGIAYDSYYNELYVTNFGNGTVSVINRTTNAIVGSAIVVGPILMHWHMIL